MFLTTNIKMLHMHGKDIMEDGRMQALAKVLPKSKIVHLEFNECTIDDGEFMALSEALPYSRVRSLSMHRCNIGIEGFCDFARTLCLTRITDLVFIKNTPILNEAMKIFSNALIHSRVRRLTLRSDRMTADTARLFGEALAQTRISTLDLKETHLDDEGMIAMLAAILKNSRLKNINLSCIQGITTRTMIAPYDTIGCMIGCLVDQNTSLESLDVSGTFIAIGDSAGESFRSGLEKTTSLLKKLNLSDCCFTDKGRAEIYKGIMNNITLIHYADDDRSYSHPPSPPKEIRLVLRRNERVLELSQAISAHRKLQVPPVMAVGCELGGSSSLFLIPSIWECHEAMFYASPEAVRSRTAPSPFLCRLKDVEDDPVRNFRF
jgi:hypothetical protein